MRYRIRIDLAFPVDTVSRSMLKKAKDVILQAVTINQGTINQEVGFATLEKCYHDEDPARPCELIASYFTPH